MRVAAAAQQNRRILLRTCGASPGDAVLMMNKAVEHKCATQRKPSIYSKPGFKQKIKSLYL